MAFTRYKGIGDIFSAKFVGFKWFESFFQSAYAKQTLVNTLRLSFYSLALFPLPIIFAVIVNEIRNEKFKKVTQTIVYAPHFVSLVILVTMLGLFLDAKGIVNNLLTSLGMEKVDFLTSDSAYPHVFVWSGIWSSWAGAPLSIRLHFPAWIPAFMRRQSWTVLPGCNGFGILTCRPLRLPSSFS